MLIDRCPSQVLAAMQCSKVQCQSGPSLTQMVPLQDGTHLQTLTSTAAVHAVAAQPQAEQPTFAVCTADAVHICQC